MYTDLFIILICMLGLLVANLFPSEESKITILLLQSVLIIMMAIAIATKYV